MTPGLVYVVEDDARVREAVSRLLKAASFAVKSFGTPEAFLAEDFTEAPACVLLDIRLPRANGFDVQRSLAETGRELPVIFISGHGTIEMSVRAMKAGAVEFLTKPFSEKQLLSTVHSALACDAAGLERRRELAALAAHYESLTSREREVMRLAIGGLLNKQMADALGTSEINVKVHKRHVMQKMGARSLADLVLMAESLHVKRALSR